MAKPGGAMEHGALESVPTIYDGTALNQRADRVWTLVVGPYRVMQRPPSHSVCLIRIATVLKEHDERLNLVFADGHNHR